MFSPSPTPSPPLSPPRTLEPRFALPDDTPRSSKRMLVIGGIEVYIYGLDELELSTENLVTVIHLAHMRTRTYAVTEGIAHELLYRHRSECRLKDKRVKMIALTMDMRNHGKREVSREANGTWSDGNSTHAADLLSTIDAAAMDFKLVLDYLPGYLPHVGKMRHVVMGVSLGGHMAYRLSLLARQKIAAFIIVVGCPSLRALLLDRLKVFERSQSHQSKQTDKAMLRWPDSIDKQVAARDEAVFRGFPRDVPSLLCGGKEDPLVPPRYTAEWLDRRRQEGGNDRTSLFIQENTGHSCTKEMITLISGWLEGL